MNDSDKKGNQKQTVPGMSEKRPVTLDELEKVTGGADFWFFDDERRKPRGETILTDRHQ